jgi:CHASE2 domain-containing sensor protein
MVLLGAQSKPRFLQGEQRMGNEPNHVVVTDIKMSFFSMVIFMVKWVIASIPAIIILSVIGAVVMAVLNMVLGGHMGHMRTF